MKFSMGNTGVDHINQGVSSIFKALAMAPYLQQQAEMGAALKNAQAYHANMSGNKAGAEAESEYYTLGQRKNIGDTIAADPNMPAYMQQALKLFGITGDTNIDRVAKAAGSLQSQGYTDQAAQNISDTPTMNKLLSVANGKAYMPFSSVGNTGYSIDEATGAQTEANPVLAKLFGSQQTALVNERNASAGASSAAAGLSKERTKEIKIGKLTPGTDENGNPILFRSGTDGETTILDDLTPYRKAGGADAAAQKARAQVVRDVYKDPLVAPEDRDAEIEKRMAAIEKGRAKSPAGVPAAPKIDPAAMTTAADIKAQFKAGKLTRDQAVSKLKALGFN